MGRVGERCALYVAVPRLSRASSVRIARYRHRESVRPRRRRLCGNSIGVRGAKSLAAMLSQNAALHSLVLVDNIAGDEGAASLFSALLRNATLRELNLGSNGISSKGCAAFTRVASYNR